MNVRVAIRLDTRRHPFRVAGAHSGIEATGGIRAGGRSALSRVIPPSCPRAGHDFPSADVTRWTDDLLRRIQEGQIDPSFVITHSVGLEEGPAMYKTFRDKEDGCIKVVLEP